MMTVTGAAETIVEEGMGPNPRLAAGLFGALRKADGHGFADLCKKAQGQGAMPSAPCFRGAFNRIPDDVLDNERNESAVLIGLHGGDGLTSVFAADLHVPFPLSGGPDMPEAFRAPCGLVVRSQLHEGKSLGGQELARACVGASTQGQRRRICEPQEWGRFWQA